ncbi:MAG: hypothetical protein CSA79_04695 [Thiothrix nivea]|nr:MAG: hypothetical protein CSA79_04695 [Thiothrix nivea]
MHNNRTIWISLVAGVALTGLLMLVLYSQISPLEQATTQPAHETTVKTAVETVVKKPVNKTVPVEPEPVDLPELPADPTLSRQEIGQLSPQEREKYEALVKTYQQVREQVLNLHRERQQLRQQMDQIIEENVAIDQQLDQLRSEQKQIKH